MPQTLLQLSIKQSLEQYFAALEDEPVTGVYRMVLEEVEPVVIATALAQVNQNQSKAAMILGMNRGTLRKKMQQYGLL